MRGIWCLPSGLCGFLQASRFVGPLMRVGAKGMPTGPLGLTTHGISMDRGLGIGVSFVSEVLIFDILY